MALPRTSAQEPQEEIEMKDQSIVDDQCSPVVVEYYTVEDLKHFSLSQLYLRTCQELAVKPNGAVLEQLPTVKGQHHHFQILNCRQSYLGNKGTAALFPVIAACPRVTHVLLAGVGLKASGARALIATLTMHPGITDVDVSHNDLGTTVGKELLYLVTVHRRIRALCLEETLIIQPIKRKIVAQVSHNYAIHEMFSVPLIPQEEDDVALERARQRAEEEAARRLRQEAIQREIAERLPVWVPAALLEVSGVFWKHRGCMDNVYSLFDVPSVASTFVALPSFQRAMGILGVSTLSGDRGRCAEFCDLFGAWRRSDGAANYAVVVGALRAHARVKLTEPPTPPTGMQVFPDGLLSGSTVDAIFDARLRLERSCETIDVDMTGSVTLGEFSAGVLAVVASGAAPGSAAVRNVRMVIAAAAGLCYPVEEPGAEDVEGMLAKKINYKQVLAAFVVDDSCGTGGPRTDWMITRTQLLALVPGHL